MFDDMPKRPSFAKRVLYIVLPIILLAVLGFFIYQILQPAPKSVAENSPSPSFSQSVSPTLLTPSPQVSSSLPVSSSPSIQASALPNYKVPAGETFSIASTADTNGDGKDETLIITKISTGKYHAYVLSSDGNSLFDNKELLDRPIRIATQTYDPSKETYLSWMLIYNENSGDLAFIHWNGTAYEIPQSAGI